MSTTERVLELLENNVGQNISGAYMAKQLGVSRTAVWKAVNSLRKNGYSVSAITNNGYCFANDNDVLSVQGIAQFLSKKSDPGKINIFESLESTNKTAKEFAVSGAEHGTIIIADSQTAGRGRYGRSFFSPPGHGIYMSFIIRPTNWLWANAPTLVTFHAAVTVCGAIESTTEKTPQIKWVNDVYIDGKKICGILTEAVTDIESGGMQWIVVGIGVNFSLPSTGLPEGIEHTAGAVFSEGKPTITRNRLAAEIANRILGDEGKYSRESLLAEYRKRLMMIGKRVTVSGWDEPFEAIAEDIDETGRLIVKKENGETMALSAGEIRIREAG